MKLQKILYYFGLCWKILFADQFAGFFTFDLFHLLILTVGVHCYVLLVFLLLCSCYVTDLIKKLELHLLVVIILFKIEFGHAQITVRKIGTLMLKTACINP